MAVDKIEPRHVADLLEPIWIPMQETLSRARSRIELVLDYALSRAGFADRKNPAMLKGLRGMRPKRTKVNKHEVVHYPAMPHADLPPFMVDLAARPAISARALEFTILTAARSGEVRHLEWSDIDGTVRAYKCTTFFDRRIELMQDWSDCLGTAFKRAKLRVVQ